MKKCASAVVILAAGKGSRMKSDMPKVMRPVAGQPMIGQFEKSEWAGRFRDKRKPLSTKAA